MIKILIIILFTGLSVYSQNFKVAILGDSRSDGEAGTDGINKEVLEKLTKMINQYNPDAVFFTGDLTLGLEKEDEEENDSLNVKNTVKEEDIYGNAWTKAGFVYNSVAFKKQLNTFSEILNRNLKGIPFYPLIGNHEAVGPDAITNFKEHFKIQNIAPIDSMHLAYTVELKNSLFVLLATDYYSRKDSALTEHKLLSSQVSWLDSILSVKSTDHKYKFVLGHEPGYSFRWKAKNKAVGLDKYPVARDEFWNVLKKNSVNGYLCAHEHLYERSINEGILQVISGGSGAPLEKGTDKAYYHFMIMEFSENAPPQVKVIDIEGSLRDEFTIQ